MSVCLCTCIQILVCKLLYIYMYKYISHEYNYFKKPQLQNLTRSNGIKGEHHHSGVVSTATAGKQLVVYHSHSGRCGSPHPTVEW